MLRHPDVDIPLEHRKVGSQHLFTSPELPGLYVAHSDRQKAWESIPSAVEMLRKMQERRVVRQGLRRKIAASA